MVLQGVQVRLPLLDRKTRRRNELGYLPACGGTVFSRKRKTVFTVLASTRGPHYAAFKKPSAAYPMRSVDSRGGSIWRAGMMAGWTNDRSGSRRARNPVMLAQYHDEAAGYVPRAVMRPSGVVVVFVCVALSAFYLARAVWWNPPADSNE
jgi:hypothetical protein